MTKARNVADLGSNDVLETTSTGIDITGTATMDGLTVDGLVTATDRFQTGSGVRLGGAYTAGVLGYTDANWGSLTRPPVAGEQAAFGFQSYAGTDLMRITEGGDISFYEDTGTTAKFFWDASAEKLTVTNSSNSVAVKSEGSLQVVNPTYYSGSYPWNIKDNGGNLSINYFTSTDQFVIKDSGNVGIGTSSPTEKLHVKGADRSLRVNPDYNSTTYLYAYNDTAEERSNLTIQGNGIQFGSTPTGSETMRIDSSGNLLVGTNSVTDAGHAVLKASGKNSFLYAGNEFNFADNHATANGDLYLNYRELAGGGSINNYRFLKGDASHSYSTLQAAAFTVTSDYRTKENIVPLDNATARVKQLKPCRFNFIDGVGMEAGRTVDGFIAHEAQEVVPEAVEGVKDAMTTKSEIVTPAQYDEGGNLIAEAVYEDVEIPAYQGIDQSKLVPLLTAALQEALTRIETLEAEVSALKGA